MVEQTQRGVGKHHLVLIRSGDALSIHDASTGGSKVGHTTPPGTMNVIGEGEEGIARARDTVQLASPLLLLLLSQRRNSAFEEALPVLLLASLENLSGDVEINGVGLLSALDALLEGEGEHLRVVTEPPEVGLSTGKTRAVDTRLLASTDSDDGAVVCVRDAVRLGVLESKGGNDQVGDSFLRELQHIFL